MGNTVGGCDWLDRGAKNEKDITGLWGALLRYDNGEEW